MCEETVHHRGRLEESQKCGFDGFACIRMFFHFNICVV